MKFPKYKANISKKAFYSYVAILTLLTFFLIIWITIPFTLGFKQSYIDALAQQSDQQDKQAIKDEIIKSGRLAVFLSYVGNEITLIVFLLYIILARHRVKVGYLFYFTWIIIYITLIAMPFYTGVQRHDDIAIGIGIVISILSGSLVITLFINLFHYHAQRRLFKYEQYKMQVGRAV
ncbi:hypothetical protein [[Mycoplasma] imitans]|uniref:hypothetical protein n=1 Tax=[Mycoplasma] imitans TaxID=29560 RepID=UPI0004850B9A|nr:hypothetical protein [[Mycoplasma] imitans]